ncbi:hypothetical protein B0H19DRAFT_1341862 [Mycena capillaripes]|nr:hypothetical protein B0H19DRAFT_1341862 [Mycena capillaripes]
MESGHRMGVAYDAEQRVNMSRFQTKVGLQRKRENEPAERKKNEFRRGTDRSSIAKGMRESLTRRSDPIGKGTLTEDPSRHVGSGHPHLRLISAAYAPFVSQDFTKIDQPECLHIHQQSVCPQTRSLEEGSASRSTNTAVIMCLFIQREAHKFASFIGARSPGSHAHIGVDPSRVVVSSLALRARSPSHRRANQRWDLRTNYDSLENSLPEFSVYSSARRRVIQITGVGHNSNTGGKTSSRSGGLQGELAEEIDLAAAPGNIGGVAQLAGTRYLPAGEEVRADSVDSGYRGPLGSKETGREDMVDSVGLRVVESISVRGERREPSVTNGKGLRGKTKQPGAVWTRHSRSNFRGTDETHGMDYNSRNPRTTTSSRWYITYRMQSRTSLLLAV